jgi:hypothetical protein
MIRKKDLQVKEKVKDRAGLNDSRSKAGALGGEFGKETAGSFSASVLRRK